MLAYAEQPSARAAIWAMRTGLFSGAMVVSAVALHRLAGMATPTALNLFLAGFAGAALALLLAALAAVQIWRTGQPGAAPALVGTFAALAVLVWPAIFLAVAAGLPRINDVTTDTEAPPQFAALASARDRGANPAGYPASTFPALQAQGYPDLRPMLIDRPVDEAFDVVSEAVRERLKYQIVAAVQPGPDQPGLIEAVDRTLVVGFYDDIAIRVTGDRHRSRIDIRSASRYGRHDFGRNAMRVRTIVREIRTQLENSVPGISGPRVAKGKSKLDKTAVPKRRKGSDRASGGPRSGQDRARSDAQRGQEPRARQR